MSITGDAGRPAVSSRRGDRRHRVRHVRGAGRRDGAARARADRAAVRGWTSAMLDATAALLTYQAGNYFATGEAPARMGNRHPTIAPYETFAGGGRRLRARRRQRRISGARFCARRGLELADDPRFATNRQRVRELRRAAAVHRRRGCATGTRADWIARAERGRRAVRRRCANRRGARAIRRSRRAGWSQKWITDASAPCG